MLHENMLIVLILKYRTFETNLIIPVITGGLCIRGGLALYPGWFGPVRALIRDTRPVVGGRSQPDGSQSALMRWTGSGQLPVRVDAQQRRRHRKRKVSQLG